jgi:hypothetical protein
LLKENDFQSHAAIILEAIVYHFQGGGIFLGL